MNKYSISNDDLELLKRVYNSGETRANKNDLKTYKGVIKHRDYKSAKQIRKQSQPFRHQ